MRSALVATGLFLWFAYGANPVYAKIIFESGFSKDKWLEKFNYLVPTPWSEGLDRAEVVRDPSKKSLVLKISYPAHQFGNDKTGTQWKTGFGKTFEHLTVSYDVKFGKTFDFVKGGKLPGLIGGHQKDKPDSTVTGGHRADGTNGWSARIMWRRGGAIVQYVYHVHQPSKWGEDFPWRIDGKPVVFEPGRWYRVKTEVAMNELGKRNGRIRSWLDGKVALDLTDMEFRSQPGFAIDTLYFSTFFGGDDEGFATSKKEEAYFDHFLVEE